MKKMIEWSKFEKLEKKYSKLSQKQIAIENRLKLFRKMPQAVINGETSEGLYLRRISSGGTNLSGVIYLGSTKIRKNHCDVCGKRRKTTAHHIIPKRLKSINKELAQIRIRVCSECEKKIHPENGYDESDLLRKQSRQVIKLKKLLKIKAESILNEFIQIIDNRIHSITFSVKGIPKALCKTPRKIHPALKKCEGRIKELKLLRGKLKRKVNMKLESNI